MHEPTNDDRAAASLIDGYYQGLRTDMPDWDSLSTTTRWKVVAEIIARHRSERERELEKQVEGLEAESKRLAKWRGNVKDFWDQVPNDLKYDPGLDSLRHSILEPLRADAGEEPPDV